MTNRREFLHAAALSALPAFAHAAERGTAEPGAADQVENPMRSTGARPDALQAFLIDERHIEARIAGARLARLGATVLPIADGDVTRVWLSHIRPAWQERPASIAGLTERAALFCLEQLGWAAGLRVVLHAEHVVHPDGHTDHTVLRGGRAGGLSARDLKRSGSQWPALVAAAIASERSGSSRTRCGPSVAALAPDLPGGARLLNSWIIAAA